MKAYWRRVIGLAGTVIVLLVVVVACGHPGDVDASMNVIGADDDGSVWFWRVTHLAVAAGLFALGWVLVSPSPWQPRWGRRCASFGLGALLALPWAWIMGLSFAPGGQGSATATIVCGLLMLCAIASGAVGALSALCAPRDACEPRATREGAAASRPSG